MGLVKMYLNTVTSAWEFKEEFRQTSLESVTDIVEVLAKQLSLDESLTFLGLPLGVNHFLSLMFSL